MAAVKVTQGFVDYSREFSAARYHLAYPAGDDLTTTLADADTVHDAMSVLTLCNFTNQNITVKVQGDLPTIPSNHSAQREIALWIQYVDNTTNKFESMQIPGPDLSLLAQANTDEVDIVANVTMAAFILAVESLLRSEVGNAVTITRARIIGRRI